MNFYNNPYMMQQPQIPQQPQGPILVQGEAAAKAYMVAPGTTVALWDSEAMTIYLKSVDQSGFPTMRILDYTIRDMAQQTNDYNDLLARVTALEQKIGGMKDESAVSAASASGTKKQRNGAAAELHADV